VQHRQVTHITTFPTILLTQRPEIISHMNAGHKDALVLFARRFALVAVTIIDPQRIIWTYFSDIDF
jgi:hypothetical protein